MAVAVEANISLKDNPPFSNAISPREMDNTNRATAAEWVEAI